MKRKFAPQKIFAVFLIVVSVALRFAVMPRLNHDLTVFNLVWYDTLSHGVARALATNFANYTPPYTYLLALATFAREWLPPLAAIKLIPTFFDVSGAALVYKIVRLKFTRSDIPFLAAAVYFAAPTVIANSSFWGQADSIYTFFLLACVYFVMTERMPLAMLAFGVSFSFKAQAVFLAPFLGALAVRKKIRWLYFGAIPLVYLLAVTPVVLLGRPWFDVLLVYLKQSNTFDSLSMNAPNLYYLLPREWLSVVFPAGVFSAALLLLCWTFNAARGSLISTRDGILLLALISAALTPFLLPKMHDRYFYPADVLSIAAAFYFPQLWFVPVFYQIVSFTAISGFLFNVGPAAIAFAVLLNAVTVAAILRAQRVLEARAPVNQSIASALSWLAALLTPPVMFGVFLTFTLTPNFIRAAYALPIPADSGMGKSERFRWASESVGYLAGDRKAKYLNRLRRDNGDAVFNQDEIAMLDKVKNALQTFYATSRVSLLALFMLGLLAWAGNWLPAWRRGIKRGGWLSAVAGTVAAFASLVGGLLLRNAYIQNAKIFADLFAMWMLQAAVLCAAVAVIACGVLVARFETDDGI